MVVIMVIKKNYICRAWSLELLGTPILMGLPGYGGYGGYEGYGGFLDYQEKIYMRGLVIRVIGHA